MGLDWGSVRSEHVEKACELYLAGQNSPRSVAKGLFLVFGEKVLPAKHVVRMAYQLANDRPLDSPLRFASGEGTVRLLRGLGFTVKRG